MLCAVSCATLRTLIKPLPADHLRACRRGREAVNAKKTGTWNHEIQLNRVLDYQRPHVHEELGNNFVVGLRGSMDGTLHDSCSDAANSVFGYSLL